jgi:hypothetical protein
VKRLSVISLSISIAIGLLVVRCGLEPGQSYSLTPNPDPSPSGGSIDDNPFFITNIESVSAPSNDTLIIYGTAGAVVNTTYRQAAYLIEVDVNYKAVTTYTINSDGSFNSAHTPLPNSIAIGDRIELRVRTTKGSTYVTGIVFCNAQEIAGVLSCLISAFNSSTEGL